MARDAIVILEQLRCISLENTESRTEPYIWPALIRVDDQTLTLPNKVAIAVPGRANARVVIKKSMRAGDTAGIPGSVGILHTRLEDNVTTRRLILVVTLLEMDETPRSAMEAGFDAYAAELQEAIGAEIFNLALADEEQQKQIIEDIKKRVEKRVKTAIEDGLSVWEKIKVLAGTLNIDDFMGSALEQFADTFLVPEAITLAFETTTKILGFPVSSKYEIRGQLQLKPVVIDRCRIRVQAVNAAQAAVNGIEKVIEGLQDQLSNEGDEGGLPKPFLIAEIERISDEELAPAELALQEARGALRFCRDRLGVAVDPRGGGAAIG